MNVSIGDFAEQIMKQDNFAAPVINMTAKLEEQVQAPDISKVEVPSTFIDQICGVPTENQVQKSEVVTESVGEGSNTESGILLEIRDLLLGLREQINEMTTSGSIGMGVPKEKIDDPSIDKKLKDILSRKKRK